MTRDEAIEIARQCAKAKPQSYYAEPFEPHEWVVDAILIASDGPPTCWERSYEGQYCVNCGKTWDMHTAGSNRCPSRRR